MDLTFRQNGFDCEFVPFFIIFDLAGYPRQNGFDSPAKRF
jgi:hypothetical protein